MNPKNLFLRKFGTDPADAEGHGTGLKKSLGALDLTLLGIGAIIGAGLFSSIKEMIVGRFDASGAVVMLGAGPAVMLSFVLTAIACGFAALCYAEISAMVPASGSAYSYSYAAFGELIAWIIGWDLIIEYAIGNVYVAQSWGDYFQSFLLGVNEHWTLPIWLTKDLQTAAAAVHGALQVVSDAAATAAAKVDAQATLALWHSAPRLGSFVLSVNLPAFTITVALTVLLWIGVRESARANAIMVFLKLGLVVTFIALGTWTLIRGGENHWHPFAPNGVKGIWQGAALGFFSYIGFDAVSTAGEETRNPQKDLPRGLIGSLLICTVLYVLVAAVLTGVVRYSDFSSNDPLAYAMKVMGYGNIATLFAFGAMVAMTAVLLVFQFGQTRIFMVMSRDGLLPPVFSRIHPKFQTPHVSTWVTGLLVACLCSILTPDQAIGLTNIGTLFAFILVSIGVIVLRRRHPDTPRPFKVPLYPLTPILSALACLGLICGLEHSNWIRLLIWLQLGFVVYAWYGVKHSRLRRKESGGAPVLSAPLGVAFVGWALVAAALYLDVRIVVDGTPKVEGDVLRTELFTAFYGLRTLALEVIGLGLLLGLPWSRIGYWLLPPIVLVLSGVVGRTESWNFVGACAAVFVLLGVVLTRPSAREWLAAPR
jgi:APA family basic amino acid/polyamine antiporter